MKKKIISTDKAPGAIGPYSQAIKIGKFIYTSGQLPIDPKSGIMPENIQEQTKQCLENLKAILETANGRLESVVKTTVFLKDMNDFLKMNEVYSLFFTSNYPARSCIQVARLPKDALVEIEAIAIKENSKYFNV